jgi:hypothetical protein
MMEIDFSYDELHALREILHGWVQPPEVGDQTRERQHHRIALRLRDKVYEAETLQFERDRYTEMRRPLENAMRIAESGLDLKRMQAPLPNALDAIKAARSRADLEEVKERWAMDVDDLREFSLWMFIRLRQLNQLSVDDVEFLYALTPDEVTRVVCNELPE